MQLQELVEVGMKFHGHKCPAMPMGLRAGLAAMEVLGVERAQDTELRLVSETGKGHAAGCFLDGLMTATGCTYGKSNIEKKYYNKMAFTLIDTVSKRSVRVSLKPAFFSKALQSPFVQKRKEGVAPQDIPAEIADPMVANVLKMGTEMFLDIGETKPHETPASKGEFEAKPCAGCGELTFVNKLQGDLCVPCSEL